MDTAVAEPDAGAAGRTDQRPRRRNWWVARRLALAVVTLFLVSVLVFAATQALPSDPARAILGREATPEQLDALRAQLGLDRPLVDQYTSWLGGVVSGDLGESLASDQPVSDILASRIWNSAVLVILAIAITVPLAVAIGAISARRRDGFFDNATNIISIVLNAVPEFVVGIVLLVLFATTVWDVLPGISLIPPGDSPFAHIDALVLPVAVLVLVSVPYLARLVRGSLIDALESDYVQMAQLKGLGSWRITIRHAFPNAMIPLLQGSALVIGYMAGGIVVIEYLFNYPGIGSALTTAVDNRDLPVIQAAVLLLATVYIAVNLIADILTVALTPRLRTATR